MSKITAGNWSYILTDEDKLWAARMSQFEGGNPAATLWTMTQAYARAPIHARYPSFTKFIQSYSQPINPIWALGGSRCPTASSDPSSPCYSARIANRARAASMPFSGASAAVQAAVNAWMAGTLPNPVPKAVDFADGTVGQHFVDNHPGAYVVLRAGNLYIATPESAGWHDNYVQMAAVAAGGAILSVALLGGAAAWAYYLYRRRRKRSGLGTLSRRRLAR